MQGKLLPLNLPPGIYRNGTKYQSQARWYAGNLVRFIDKTIRPIGGWRTAESAAGGPLGALTGVGRGAIAWRSITGAVRVGVGTHLKAYAIVDGTAHDITPAGFTVGDQDSVFAGGTGTYGSGVYGSGVYGSGSVALVLDEADTWQLDTYGDYLVGVFTEDGKLYYWDGNTVNDFVQATDSPTQNRGVMVTHERYLVALGASNNVRQIKWATQEGGISVAGNWTPSASNTAGDWILETRGRIMAGRRTKKENLIWTDVDLHRMRYIGGTLVYAFEQAGDACGLIAPNAVAVVESRAYWMGRDNFFTYDGFVQPLPSEVRDYVFSDFNAAQAAKVWAMPNSKYGEVWWFYCSGGATEIDRYVVYNYIEGHWTFGDLSRTIGFDLGATPYPTLLEISAAAVAAQATLTSTGVNVSNGDTVTINGKTYTFQTTLTDVDGNVHIGANAAGSLSNLYRAIGLGTGAGTDYAAAMTVHTTVEAITLTATTVVVRAKVPGSAGNAYATTEVSTQLSWGGGTMSGGTDATSLVREHEVGDDRGSEVPFLESGPIEIAEGDRIMSIHGLVPDEKTLGDVALKMYTSFFPTDAETENGPYTLTAPTDLRLAARQVRLRLDQAREVDWRIGIPRLAVTPTSRR